MQAGRKTNAICEQIQTVLAVDVHVLVLVQFGFVTDASDGRKAFYREQLQHRIANIWNDSVAQPVNLVFNIHGNTVLVAATSASLKSFKVVDETQEEVSQVCAYEFASGNKLIVAALSWRTNMPRAQTYLPRWRALHYLWSL